MDAFNQAPRFDLGSWASNWTAFNATQFVPSARDLALAGPRMMMKLGSYLALPEAVDNIFGAQMGERIIPEATGGGAGAGIVEAVTTAATSAREVAQSATEILVDIDDQTTGLASRFSLEGARSIGNIFGYVTSKWAILCFVMAIVLNRTQIYASTRRNLVLPWKVRLAIRLIPFVLLLVQCKSLLHSIQCQTSPDFALLRWGNASKSSELMFTQNGGLLHTVSSTLLFGATDEESCLAINMIAPKYDAESSNLKSPPGARTPLVLTGSLSRLWPLFKTFSLSQIVESVSCAVQGRQIAAETGMTIFEHSLAFAEAEAAIGNQLGFGSFGGSKTVKAWTNSTSQDAQHIAITRAMIMERVNTPPEVLFVGYLSGMNHLTNHVFAVLNIQGRMRLFNTGFWGMAFMSVISWGLWSFSLDDYPSQSLLRYPTVCIVGFIPHVLVFCGIIICLVIYGAALILSAIAPPATGDENGIEDGLQARSTFLRRLKNAHQNMQANVPLSNIRISLHMDFYTALLRAGFSVMTMASEAVYLNESRAVGIKERTWLEEERLQEIEALGAQWLGPNFALRDPESLGDGLSHGVGLVAATDQPMDSLRNSSSGYAKEMTTKKKTGTKGHDRVIRDGVGATERSGRWIMALEFFWGINRLVLSWWASAALKFLAKAGFQARPPLLVWLARRSKPNSTEKEKPGGNDPDSLNFWLLNVDGELTLPQDENVDVEEEMRNRIRNSQGTSTLTGAQETKLESTLYTWWLRGGWWGGNDSSGDFIPGENEIDDDTTSVVSFSTTADDQDWESDDDGQRTPTQRSPQASRESTPFHDTPLHPSDLAQLLHPKTPEQRAEAQALSVHLSSPNIVTRSRYRAIAQRERSRVLTSTLHRPADFATSAASGKLTPEEETELLEHLIITSRGVKVSASSQSHPAAWAKGASGMGEGGPQCVVCQSSPRSIIVWPCRCLSLCDDCRVTLAMNNFDKCVCCRRDVASFSRIFVP